MEIQQVVDAKSTGTLFRGFEKILIGRDPQDAQHITQRICGVCPVPHGMASVLAQDKAYGVSVPSNARIMRNLVMGANFIQSHILHFYHLALQDFVDGPAMPPWQPSWSTDKRISGNAATTLVNNYVSAIDMTRKAHELGALFGGRMPDPPAYIAGGFTGFPRTTRITQANTYLNDLISFINNFYIPDVDNSKSLPMLIMRQLERGTVTFLPSEPSHKDRMKQTCCSKAVVSRITAPSKSCRYQFNQRTGSLFMVCE